MSLNQYLNPGYGRRFPRIALLSILFSVLVIACSGDDAESPTDPGDGQPTVDRIEVTPGADTVTALDETRDYDAVALSAGGDTVTTVSFTWSSTDQAVATVDGNGVAEAAADGETEIRASAEGLTGSAALIVDQQPASVTMSPASATLTAIGDTVRLSASAADANGNPVSGADFTWSSGSDAVASVNSAGLVTGRGNGETSITAASGRVSSDATVTVNQAVDHLAFRTGPTSDVAGDTIDPAIKVAVLDAAGNVVEDATSSVTLSFGVNAGGGTLSGPTTVSAESGVVTFDGLWIDRAATGYTLEATVNGNADPATSQAFDISAAAASQLAFRTGPSDTTAGAAMSPAVEVEVRDEFGNLVSSSSASVSMGFGSNPSGATLFGNTNVSASNGVATFGDLSIEVADSAYTLAASASGLDGAVSGTFRIEPAAASRLAFATGPSNVEGLEPIAPAVEVEVVDAYGNRVTDSSATVALALATDPTTGDASGGGTTLYGTTTVTASDGLATFSSLSLNRPGEGFTVEATSTGLTGTTSGTFNVNLTFQTVSAVGHHTCGLTTANHVFCWGRNNNGKLGDGTTTTRSRPVAVEGGQQFSYLSAGNEHTCALTTADEPYCWGSNGDGRIGDATTTDRTVPAAVDVSGLATSTFSRISAGSQHTCGVSTSDVAYCWGHNGYGQLGDGSTTARHTPVQVAGGQSFSQVQAGGAQSCGLTTGGEPYCWGYNRYGQLGDGTTTDSPTPVAVDVSGLPTQTFVQITAGGSHSCALSTADEPFCWGRNADGQLGDGTFSDSSTPVGVDVSGVTPSTFAQLSANGRNTCGLTTNDEPYCWGWNQYGQIGDDTTIVREAPVAVDVSGLSPQTFRWISTGGAHSCAISTTDAAYCWGRNDTGQLGDGTVTQQSTPVWVIQ